LSTSIQIRKNQTRFQLTIYTGLACISILYQNPAHTKTGTVYHKNSDSPIHDEHALPRPLDNLAQLPEIIIPIHCELDDIPPTNRSERPEPMSVPDSFELGIPGVFVGFVVTVLRVDGVLIMMMTI
jgi:hypothetical protein